MFAAESWGDERLARKELLALHTKLGHAAFPHLVGLWLCHIRIEMPLFFGL